ncbi:Vascular endothelial growth factor receptor 3 [Mactra antiquata]
MGPYGGKKHCVYTLSSEKAVPDDNGMWRCELINSHGVASATCTVRVIDTISPPESELSDDEKLPRFVETLENLLAKEDHDLELICKTNPNQELIVKWYKNDIPIQGTTPGMERYYTFQEEGVQKLEIKRSRPRDTGIYKCKIANKVGWVSCDAKLVFKDTSDAIELARFSRESSYSLVDTIRARNAIGYDQKNEADILLSSMCDSNAIQKFLLKWRNDNDDLLGFPIHLRSKCSVEGSQTVLSCLLTGKPYFDIRWYKDNQEIHDGFKYYLKNLQGVLSLTIPSTAVDDTGNYMCIVKNRQGKIYTSCYLQVEPTIELHNDVPIKPMFTKPLKRTTVNEGELINLRASVKGYPPPGFKWFKDGLEVHDSERITTEMSANGVAQLTITNACVRDIGLYSCEAHNMAGRAQSMVRVSVRDKLEEELWRAKNMDGVTIETEGKQITNGDIENEVVTTVSYEQKIERKYFDLVPEFKMALPKALTIQSKQRFLMEIRCSGNPKPFVRWFKDGLELFDELRYNFLSAGDWFGIEIACTQPRDAGRYTVKVQNEAGYSESSCVVEMALPVCKMNEILTELESIEEISTSVPFVSASKSDLTSEAFSIAQIVPSCTLCNTEADWTTHIDKEVEVLDADEAPSFPHLLPDKICPHENDENVHIECQVRGEPIPKIVWLKDGWDLKDGSNITFSMDPKTRISSLTIKKASIADSGQYSCVAYGDFGGHAQTTTDIQVLPMDMVDDASEDVKRSIPEFKVKLEDKEATPGAEIRLECKAEGFPAPKVKWYKNDTPITPTIGKYTITSSVEGYHSLIIAGLRVSDGDCYKCEAINELGASSSAAHIFVQEQCEVGENMGDAPAFETSLHNLTVNAGQTASFVCTARGKPTPIMSWHKDGVNISKYGSRFNIINDNGTTTLTIESATLEDAGLYICTAENTHGKIDACASIKVNEVIPETGTYLQDTTEGRTLVTNTINDTKESKTDEALNGENKIGETVNGDIQDGGNIENENGSLTLKQATVLETEQLDETVTSDPLIVSTSTDYKKRPRFVLPPMSQWTTTERSLKLEVVVTDSPDLKVNWYHDDKPVCFTEGRYKLTEQKMDV